MIITPGTCGLCSVPFDRMNYTELPLELNNGTLCKAGICVTCANSIDDIKKNRLLENIKQTWTKELTGTGTKKQLEDIDAIDIKEV